MENNPRIPFQLATERPRFEPPGGKPLIVHVVVNLEVWPFDEPMPRSIFDTAHGKPEHPDIPNFSWVEYGLRCGVPRLIRILGERGLPASNFMNAAFPDYYPSCAAAALEAGWEVTGHQIVQRSLRYEEDEEAVIAEVVERLTRFAGYPPRGWLGPGSGESMETPDLLRKHGFEYIYDWQFDDLPCWMRTRHGPMIALPYALELNDVIAFSMHKQTADEWFQRFAYAVETFESELSRAPRVLTLALHPHVAAIPMRAPVLARILDMLMARDDTVFMTGGQIAEWFRGQDPEGLAAVSEGD